MAKPYEISALDVIGPNMIGPSSSHTAGALRISLLAAQMMSGEVKSAKFLLYGSFARTYQGHGTDRALVGGILGFKPDDPRIRESFEIAKERGITYSFEFDYDDDTVHPNTVDITLRSEHSFVTVRGESVGGGRAVIRRINGVEIEFTGLYNTIMIYHIDRPGVVARLTNVLADNQINIAFMRLYREQKGKRAYMIIETDETIPEPVSEQLNQLESVERALIIPTIDSASKLEVEEGNEREAELAERERDLADIDPDLLDFNSAKALVESCRILNLPISEVMIRREELLFNRSRRESLALMERAWSIMKQAVHDSIHNPRRSIGGLIGGESSMLERQRKEAEAAGREALSGNLISRASQYAMGVLEVNASMGLIVAAPTAGAAGIVPGTLIAIAEQKGFSDEEMIHALYTCAAIGMLIMAHGSVSGAEGGCQAETGSASAMAAAAVTQLLGGSPQDACGSASTCLQNVLGLVCDPIGGLVEAPCQRRNSLGTANAILAAEMSLAGLDNIVPLDEMIIVTRDVGSNLPSSLRETGLGGTAVAPSACAACGLC